MTPVASHAVGMSAGAQAELVKQYCTGCHNDRSKAGELTLGGWNVARGSAERDLTEKMIHKLRAGMMPPAGARRPEPDQLTQLITALESRMDAAAAADPDPGWRPFQRLNRAEYAREIRHLLDLDVDITAFLPADTISDGFDNVANVLKVSPSFLDQYISAARAVAVEAVGDATGGVVGVQYTVKNAGGQQFHVEGLPLGTRGGMVVEHTFPADGEYELNIGNLAVAQFFKPA